MLTFCYVSLSFQGALQVFPDHRHGDQVRPHNWSEALPLLLLCLRDRLFIDTYIWVGTLSPRQPTFQAKKRRSWTVSNIKKGSDTPSGCPLPPG